jgi:hypothetical protein
MPKLPERNSEHLPGCRATGRADDTCDILNYTTDIPQNMWNTKSCAALGTIGSPLSTQQSSGRQASVTDPKQREDDLVPLDGDCGEGIATPARPVSQLAICCPPYRSISLARQTKHQEENSAKISSKTSFRRQTSMSSSSRFLVGQTARHSRFSLPNREGTLQKLGNRTVGCKPWFLLQIRRRWANTAFCMWHTIRPHKLGVRTCYFICLCLSDAHKNRVKSVEDFSETTGLT